MQPATMSICSPLRRPQRLQASAMWCSARRSPYSTRAVRDRRLTSWTRWERPRTPHFSAAPVHADESVLFLNNRTNFTTAGHVVRIGGGGRVEVRRIGELSQFALGVPTYDVYPVGAIVEAVDMPLEATMRKLTADAKAGNNYLELDNIVGLKANESVITDRQVNGCAA
jgi:hypothetical protein